MQQTNGLICPKPALQSDKEKGKRKIKGKTLWQGERLSGRPSTVECHYCPRNCSPDSATAPQAASIRATIEKLQRQLFQRKDMSNPLLLKPFEIKQSFTIMTDPQTCAVIFSLVAAGSLYQI